MSSYHLAQLNLAKARYSLEAPEMTDFVNNLDKINELAERTPGFVWRLQTEEGDATSIDYFGQDIIVNMSVWQDVDALRAFAFDSEHTNFVRRRKEWFDRMEEAYLALWWVPAGHEPSLEEANQKIQLLREKGPTEQVFNFRKLFAAPGVVVEQF